MEKQSINFEFCGSGFILVEGIFIVFSWGSLEAIVVLSRQRQGGIEAVTERKKTT